MLSRCKARLRQMLLAWNRAQLHLSVLMCQGLDCRRFSLAHRLLRKDGILLNGDWLCSPRCLRAALRQRLSRRAPAARLSMPVSPRMPFRLHLLKSGALTEEGLQTAFREMRETGQPLGRVLLRLRLVTAEQLAAAQAAEQGCAFYTLAAAPVAAELELPPRLAAQYTAATLHGNAERILIGFVQRIDRGLLGWVEEVTGRKAQGCFITASRREAQLALCAPPRADRELAGRPLSSAQAGVRILEHAIATGAEQIQLARLNDLLWVRYARGPLACGDLLLCLLDEAGSTGAPVPRESGVGKKLRVL